MFKFGPRRGLRKGHVSHRLMTLLRLDEIVPQLAADEIIGDYIPFDPVGVALAVLMGSVCAAVGCWP